MKRFKSIDFLRGIHVFLMIVLHYSEWWLVVDAQSLKIWLFHIFEPIGATGFLFISGVSASLSYKSSKKKLTSTSLDWYKIKNIYLLRALILLFIALIYNLILSFRFGDLSDIWSWNVLQTIAVSLIIVWPLLKLSKTVRLIVGISIIIINQALLIFLSPFEDQLNFYGILFHLLYNPLQQFTILSFFPFFLFGTVIGDIIFGISAMEDENERRSAIKDTFLKSVLILGGGLIVIGVLYQFPYFLERNTFPSFIYSIGVILVIFSILISIEEFNLIKARKNYNFFFFYSYYSFTVYLGHNVFYFLFFNQLNAISFWIPIILTMSFITILIRIIYKKLGPKASLKTGISTLSYLLVTKFNRKEAH
ncbi:MAG: heparan-alpha-glucosaminide N-acetyltransferase domain-containing protein [Promethearchaeota archaeon]